MAVTGAQAVHGELQELQDLVQRLDQVRHPALVVVVVKQLVVLVHTLLGLVLVQDMGALANVNLCYS
jgi:hypothetical protein